MEVDNLQHSRLLMPEELEYDDTKTSEYGDYDGREDDYRLVRVTKKDFSLYELFRKYNNGKLILDVDFQRRDVWKNAQKIELIESILMGNHCQFFILSKVDKLSI